MHDPKLIEETARAIRRDGLGTSSSAATAALTALCTLRPDVAAVLRGEAVAVPREATPEMRRANWLGQYSLANAVQAVPASIETVIALTERRMNDAGQRENDHSAYRAMLEASPYAQETPND